MVGLVGRAGVGRCGVTAVSEAIGGGCRRQRGMFVSATTEVLADTAVLYELRLTWIGVRPVQ